MPRLLQTPAQRWCLFGIDNGSTWLNSYAAIMGLQPQPQPLLDLSQPHIFIKTWSAHAPITLTHLNKIIRSLKLPSGGWQTTNHKIFELCHHPHYPHRVVFMRDYSKIDADLKFIQMASLLNPIFRQTIDHGGTCYHGGLIEYQGQGILLSGPSGTGKSTCCRRIPAPWQALSDDECLISWHDEQFKVQPLPTWSAFSSFNQTDSTAKKTWDTSRVLPLRAIFLLQQGKEDKASPVTSGEAVISLVREALGPFLRAVTAQQRQDADIIHYRTQIFNNICHLAKTVPVYDLSVRKDGEFWREIERVLG